MFPAMGGPPAMTRHDAGLPLFLENDKIHHFPHDTSPYHHRRRRFFLGVVFLTFAFLLSATYFQYPCWHWRSSPPPEIVTADVGLPKEVQQAWASHSPYFPAAEYTVPPEGCEVVQVNLLQRHGTRFPTTKNSREIKKPLRKLQNAGSYSRKKYQFLKSFKWDLGVDDLLPRGAREAFDSGSEHYLRYKHLVKGNQLPFVRASDSQRVVYSAANWTQGFSTASGHVYSPSVSVIISEEKGANNTLDDFMCPNAKGHKKPAKAWRDRFTPPIVEKINEAVAGVKLGNKDVAGLMPLCAFETHFHETPSPFCDLFTTEEWQAHEYYDDLLKYYNTGYGNSLGPVQGVGYVNELLARLTGQPVQDKTQTNRTLDASPVTFPLDRNFYADFSHVDQMLAIYSAIGLFRPAEPPITDGLDLARKWRISRMAPFSGRMVVEKLRCSDGGEYIRILVNDAVQPLEFCGGDKDGLCTLSAFVESQAYARSNGDGDWDKCFS